MTQTQGCKPNIEMSPNCPRCGSSNTKFCYYNNYSSTQPRYFCKGCRRYWTKGGCLRNVPIGGGYRKSRRGNNKTLRQSIEAIKHSDDARKSSASSSPSEGPNIDLAQIYASFLNQKPDSGAGIEKPDQVQTVLYPSPENLSLSNTYFGLGLTECLHFHEQSTEHYFSEEGHVQMYFCGFNSVQKHHEYNSSSHANENLELPPLPSEEALPSHDMLWFDSEMMVNHALLATQPPLFGPEAHEKELLTSNWSPFDLSWDASISGPS